MKTHPPIKGFDFKAFLDPEFYRIRLSIVSREYIVFSFLRDTRHRISEVVNKNSGDNFYAFINGFRFREFINCITEDRYPNYTITAIALECGFKSNSVFYSVFRKNTGMTKMWTSSIAFNI